jgi:hypothetical protein
MKISWDDLNYSVYAKQDFSDDYIEESKVIDYDENNEPISNNGEKWLVYHENDRHPYFKLQPYIKKEELINFKKGFSDFIKFFPTKGTNSIILKLNRAVKKNPNLLLLYP